MPQWTDREPSPAKASDDFWLSAEVALIVVLIGVGVWSSFGG